ncbi:MAG: PAS domain S-box protein [Gammaproteobacteria bacterium]|nr:MAG: PAS domain S-box protein [Gammaproteobacteria bacterium]
MSSDPDAAKEARRLDALDAYRVLDTEPEPVFDDLVGLAASLADAPMAVLSFIDERRQWFKAAHGLSISETPRDIAFCAHTIRQVGATVIADAQMDVRFAENPLVRGEPRLRFYAGVPLAVDGDVLVGTLAVMDVVPRQAHAALMTSLEGLARLAVDLLDARLEWLRAEDRIDREQRRGALIESQERALKAAHAELNFHLENTPLAMVELDQHTRIRRWSRQAQELFGYFPDEVMGRRLDEVGLVHPEDMPSVALMVEKLVSGADIRNTITNRNISRSGEVLVCQWYNSGRRDERGQLISLQSFASDITARVRAEAQLIENRQLLEIAGRTAQLGGWRVDLETGRIKWSDEVAAIHDEPPGTTPDVDGGIAYYAPEYRDRIRALFSACVEHGEPYDEELEIITARGRRVWVRTIGEPVRDAGGQVVAIQGAFQDISRRKASEEELRQSEERYRHAAEASQAALWDYDMDSDELTFSEAFRDMLGYDEVAQMPQSMTAYMELMHPDDRNRVRRRAQELVSGITGDRASAEFRLLTASGEYRWFQSNSKLIRDANDRPWRRLGSTIDIHDRRIAEDQVRQSQRLEAIGQLTGGVAHDFNNLLTVILGNAELLTNQLRGAPEQGRLAEMIGAAAHRGAELTHRLLAFARRQPLQPRPTDVTELITGMQGLLGRSLPETIAMSIHHGKVLWPADIDPSQLESALLNLALNARDAMPEGGELTITTGTERVAAGAREPRLELSPGDYVVVKVADSGTGIAPEHRDRLFAPFFTTKKQGKGTGLGLAMVYGFIKQSSGHITVDTELGRGTAFKLYLPRAQRPVPKAAATPRAKATGGAERILIVEDDPLVREHVTRLLVELGYQTESAADGVEALAKLDAPGSFDLVFSDVVMPGGMSGFDLAARARATHPELPVLLTSGYADTALTANGRAAGVAKILQKPYSRADLARRIRGLLN